MWLFLAVKIESVLENIVYYKNRLLLSDPARVPLINLKDLLWDVLLISYDIFVY